MKYCEMFKYYNSSTQAKSYINNYLPSTYLIITFQTLSSSNPDNVTILHESLNKFVTWHS